MSYIIDSHCDTLGLLKTNDFLCGSREMNVSLPRLIKGNVRIQCFAICVHPDENGKCRKSGLELLHEFDRLTEYSDAIFQIKKAEDIDIALNSGKLGAVLTLEGADMLDCDSDYIDFLFEKGVRIFAFTWNNSNFLAGGIGENKSGLTVFGNKMLEKCEENGILIDVSHISENGFFDIAEKATKPFIASHSNAKRLCNNPRNLSDAQLLAIKNANGCVGINFYPPFLNDSGKASLSDVINHIEYISSFIGYEYVSLGSDFDGTDNDLPKGLEHPGKYQAIPDKLARLNYSEEQIDAICHGNIVRVLKEVLP